VAAQLDPAGRRELVRLMLEDGLSPREAAARLGVSESTARRWRARAGEILPDSGIAEAERSIRQAEQLMASVLAPVAPRQVRERPVPPRPVERAPLLRGVPARVRAMRWTRRQAGGVALTMAFIPAGWFLSAAVFGGVEAIKPLAGGPPAPAAVDEFDPELATARSAGRGTSMAAHVRGRSIVLHRKPGGKRIGRLRARRIEGKRIPLVLLVQRRRDGWLRVRLPVRPNGSLAWVRSRDVRLRVNPYRVEISLRRHRMTLWRYGRRLASKRVGLGQAVAPTPTGRYFVTDLIKARDPKGLYGPYAFGLSGFSPVHTTFRGGDGQIGIHGTDQPRALGTDVSQGCIRVGNETITALAGMLPLGTPVDIRRD
jgi:transposase-like protein